MEIVLQDLSQSGSQDTTYPKLRMAVETGHKEFVGHMYSQQVAALTVDPLKGRPLTVHTELRF